MNDFLRTFCHKLSSPVTVRTPEDRFVAKPGVLETVVGYTGGSTPFPTYQSIGDHTEALRITFDPRKLPIKTLICQFWKEHDPAPSYFGRQYRSALFYHSDSQLEAAEDVRKLLIADSPFASKVENTALEPAGPFYRAEEYHQRFLEKQRRGSLWTPSI